MKFNVVYDQKRNVVGAIRSGPQKLANGQEVAAVVRLQPGQKSHVVEVPDHLRGADLLKHVAKLLPAA